MPKSRVRKRTVYTPPPPKTARRKVSAPWVGPAIGACLIVGLAWIVTYYLAGGSVPGLSALGAWNLVVGFGFVIAAVIGKSIFDYHSELVRAHQEDWTKLLRWLKKHT